MKSERMVGPFTVTMVSLATVLAFAVVAAGATKTVKACASKKTGVMRLLTKGSCKSRERTVTLAGASQPSGIPLRDGNGSLVPGVQSIQSLTAYVMVSNRLWTLDLRSLEWRPVGPDTDPFPEDKGGFWTDAACSTSPVTLSIYPVQTSKFLTWSLSTASGGTRYVGDSGAARVPASSLTALYVFDGVDCLDFPTDLRAGKYVVPTVEISLPSAVAGPLTIG